MALLSNWLNGDTFDLLRDKVNAIVSAVNFIGGGAAGQVPVKASSTDFDYTLVNLDRFNTTSATSNDVTFTTTKTFTVSSGLTLKVGNAIRAYSSGTPANFISGSVASYSGTTLVINIGVIGGSGTGITDWIITNGSDFNTTIVQTNTAAASLIMAGVTFTAPTFTYTYERKNNFIDLSFKVVTTTSVGAVLTEILVPLPDGITKDTTGGASGFIWYGQCSLLAPSSTTDSTMLNVASYKDGTEGQRIRLFRTTDGATDITLSGGVTLTLRGQIRIPITL